MLEGSDGGQQTRPSQGHHHTAQLPLAAAGLDEDAVAVAAATATRSCPPHACV
jgi:hypothetical protein